MGFLAGRQGCVVKYPRKPNCSYIKIFDILTIAEVFSLIKEIEIQGCVTVPEEVSGDDFIDKFLAFIEENNWSFGGGYRTIIDGYYMNEDGTRGKHVLDA